jgi:cell division septation protein DedD
VNRYDNDGGPDRDYVGRRSSSVLDDPEPADREISLGTPTILGIFFALALVCAAFFGFGYTMGRKSSQSTFSPAEPNLTTTTGGVKPTAGSPAAIKAPPQIPDSAVVVPTSTTPAAPAPSSKSTSPADGMIVGDRPPAPAAVQPATSAPPPAGSFVVQVAAVSSQDVADIELAALQKKGYNVAIRHEPQDKLLHIQIGPFPDKKEAEAMRQRVIADGFNAIVK